MPLQATLFADCASASEPPFARAVAYGSYEGGLRELDPPAEIRRRAPRRQCLGRMLAEAIASPRTNLPETRSL